MELSVKDHLKTLTTTFYDLQQLRIQHGNRLCRNFHAHLGQEPGMGLDELSPDAKKLLAQLRGEYELLADALTRVNLTRWQAVLSAHVGLISTPYEYVLAETYTHLEQNEERLERELAALIAQHPLWTGFLADVRGVGPIMAAVILSELDPHKARHQSSFWKYVGVDVAEDGAGRSKRSEHLVKRTYINKKGEQAERDSITYNPWVKTKLVGVMSGNFLRAGGHYADLYRQYKHRLESRPDVGLAAEERGEPGATKLHRHRMAARYATKLFLADLWRYWRELEGLPVGPSYQEAYLHHTHGAEAV